MSHVVIRHADERDEYAWLLDQAAALRNRGDNQIDRDGLSDYLTDMAARDRRELRSRLIVLTSHIYKCRLCPDRITRSWVLTIREQQDELTQILRFSPSLRAAADEQLAEIRRAGFDRAMTETGTSPSPDLLLSIDSIGSLDEILTARFEPTMHPSTPILFGTIKRRRTR